MPIQPSVGKTAMKIHYLSTPNTLCARLFCFSTSPSPSRRPSGRERKRESEGGRRLARAKVMGDSRTISAVLALLNILERHSPLTHTPFNNALVACPRSWDSLKTGLTVFQDLKTGLNTVLRSFVKLYNDP